MVYANRALHLTRVDVRLGLLYSAGELGGLLAAIAVPALIKHLAIGPATAAFLTGLLAEVLPIRLTFGLLTISAMVGAGLAGWSCLGSRPLSAVSVAAPAAPAASA